uniref:NADH dehydrogenase subunit 6 n=1 Tax=Fulvia mutica TaxID=80828 RepID=T2HG56_FULMU|nr:NADH dehydrogenase subunit 6 [Fulvia mutica]BAN79054.1 NADH dehydrogenase subunit 6 [Fulvia mutica]
MSVLVKTFFILILVFSVMSVVVEHPLSLGLLLVPLVSSVSVSMCLYKSVFFGFVLFMIIVGGMLVIFAYATALSPMASFSASGSKLPVLMLLFSCLFWLSGYLSCLGWGRLCESAYAMFQLCGMGFTYSWGVTSIYLCFLLFVMMVVVAGMCGKKGGAL